MTSQAQDALRLQFEDVAESFFALYDEDIARNTLARMGEEAVEAMVRILQPAASRFAAQRGAARWQIYEDAPEDQQFLLVFAAVAWTARTLQMFQLVEGFEQYPDLDQAAQMAMAAGSYLEETKQWLWPLGGPPPWLPEAANDREP